MLATCLIFFSPDKEITHFFNFSCQINYWKSISRLNSKLSINNMGDIGLSIYIKFFVSQKQPESILQPFARSWPNISISEKYST